MRHFPRPIEHAVRYLDKLLADEMQPRNVRFRCAELLLASYGLVSLDAKRTPKHHGLKGLISARLELSAVDKEIAGRVRAEQAEDRQRKRRQKELTKLLAKYEGEAQSGAKENKPDPRIETKENE